MTVKEAKSKAVEKKETGYLMAIRQFEEIAYRERKSKQGSYFSLLRKILENAEDETNDKVYWTYGGPWNTKKGIVICDIAAIKGLWELGTDFIGENTNNFLRGLGVICEGNVHTVICLNLNYCTIDNVSDVIDELRQRW